MSQQPPDEEFERRLRDVLRSRELGLPVPADALNRVHEGARRRQQRRVVASTTSAFLVVAVVGGGIAVRNLNRHGGSDRAAASTPTASPGVASASGIQSPAPGQSVAPVQPSLVTPPSSAVAIPPVSSAAPTHYPNAGSSVPSGFTPMSVTAVNAKTFWVLGTQQCGQQNCTAIARTTDGGGHFSEIAAPHAATIAVDNSTRVIYNLRFADDSNGWAFGDALWTTSDGGTTWHDTSLPAGSVKDLEAARSPGAAAGTAWAVVQPNGGGGYELWQAPYASGTGTGSWQQVDLGGDLLGDTNPSLVVKGAKAYLLGADSKNVEQLYVAASGVATTMHAAPCVPLAGEFSTGIGSLWTICPSTSAKSGGAIVSTDNGATWHAAKDTSKLLPGVLGGIDPTTAVIDDSSGLVVVSTTAQPKAATISGQTNGFSFIGFTDAKIGFALSQADSARLWRTIDGGRTWAVVTFGS